MIGQTISHYRVLEKIGAGGMGVVYRAHDERLDRDVALKVLRQHSLSDAASRRHFRKEALTLSKLNHPNIAIVFDFDAENDTDFLVTEYVPGVTLDAKLATGHLPEAEVLRLGMQLAEGLEAAHAQGIVHRDLKPGNLRLTPEGRLKILDFGLARLVPRASELGLTETATKSHDLTGTLPYMAPEQLRGEPPDARSDIWATGVVLYEVATGRRPFPETSAPPLLHAILNARPASMRDLNQETSAGFEAIVLKALEKDADRRYQSARELGSDLERASRAAAPIGKSPTKVRRLFIGVAIVIALLAMLIGVYLLERKHSATAVRPRRSVAVLGFKNLTGKPDAAWMSTALSEMLTTELGATGRLRTISGENVAHMKADLSLPESESLANDTLEKVYRILGSDLVVLGSYLQIGDQIRVDLRVQDTAGGGTTATASETGTEAQFFDLVKRAGNSLRQTCGAGELTPEEKAAEGATQPVSLAAVRLYSEGLTRLRKFEFLAARDLLDKAVNADPANALARATLANVWSELGYDEKAREESKKAFATSGNLSRNDKILIEAQYREQSHEWDKAVDLYRSLWTFYPDELEHGLHLAKAQVAGGRGQAALITVETLRTLPEPVRDDPRIDMAEAVAAESLSDFKREQSANQRAIGKARRQGERVLAAKAILQQCWALRNTGELENAKAAGQQAKEVLAAAGDLRGEARSLTCVANVLADQGSLSQARGMHERALELARTVGARQDIAGALINIGNISALQQTLSESTKSYKEALAVASEIRDKPTVLLAQNNIGANLMVECDFSAARAILQAALETAREIGDEAGGIDALMNLGIVFANQGDFAGAKKRFADALNNARGLGLKSSMASILTDRGDVALAEDDLAGAEQSYREALAIRTELGERVGIANSELALAALQIEKNDPAAALALGQKAAQEFAADKVGDQEASAHNLIAEAFLTQKKLAESQSELEHARQISPRDQSVVLALEITSARLLSAAGRQAEALQQLNNTLSRVKHKKLPGYEFQVRLAQAEAHIISGQRDLARSSLQQLEKDSSRAGFKLIARKAAQAHENAEQ